MAFGNVLARATEHTAGVADDGNSADDHLTAVAVQRTAHVLSTRGLSVRDGPVLASEISHGLSSDRAWCGTSGEPKTLRVDLSHRLGDSRKSGSRKVDLRSDATKKSDRSRERGGAASWGALGVG